MHFLTVPMIALATLFCRAVTKPVNAAVVCPIVNEYGLVTANIGWTKEVRTIGKIVVEENVVNSADDGEICSTRLYEKVGGAFCICFYLSQMFTKITDMNYDAAVHENAVKCEKLKDALADAAKNGI
jgi:hypothetical protein